MNRPGFTAKDSERIVRECNEALAEMERVEPKWHSGAKRWGLVDWATQGEDHVTMTWVDGTRHRAALPFLEDSVPMEEDPLFQRHLEELANKCTCCHECWDVPCGGCQAGAPCDNYCHCDESQ